MHEMTSTDIDLTDLSSFNKTLGTSRGVGSIGLRNSKNLFEKTDVLVRSILCGADNSNDETTPQEVYRLGKLYGCGFQGVKKVKNIVSHKNKTNNDLFKYKPSDWESVRMKLWNSHCFKDFGVQRLAEYQQQMITLSKLESLLEYTLQIQFTQREVAALVSELRCTTVILGETVIQFPLLLTELKLLGNAARSNESSQQLQQQLFHQQQQHEKEEKEQSVMSNTALANQLKDLSIDCAILYTALRSVSSGCQLSWKKEKTYFIQLLHEIPTGTLDSDALREFFSYNINTKLTSQDSELLIFYFNGLLHRFSNTISLSDLVKDMKLLALAMPAALLAPPNENSQSGASSSSSSPERWYDHWCQGKVKEIEIYFRTESQRFLRLNDHQSKSSGIGSHLNRLKKRNHHSHLLSRLKISQHSDGFDEEEGSEGGSAGEEEGEGDDDVTVSTIGMESINSPIVKLKPIAKAKSAVAAVGKRKIISQLKRQSSSSTLSSSLSTSTSTSSSSVKLSPIKPLSTSSTILSSSSSSSSPAAAAVVDIRGKVQSIHYNLASPHIFSIEATKERNQLLKQLEQQQQHEDHSEDKSSVSLSSKNGGEGKALSFALGAAIVLRAHHVKAKLAEENEEILSTEMAIKRRQEKGETQSHASQSRMGLPTKVGYYEVTRGSTILRAKTPMYLIRPVNGSDSVLALSKGKGLGSIANREDNSNSDNFSISVSSLHSNDSSSYTTMTRDQRRKKKKNQDDMRIQNTIRSELECGSLDEKGIGLRYDLRYQEVGEFVRCLKVSAKTSVDGIVVSLWNDVQQRTGKGLNTMSETGVVIDRPFFVHCLHESLPLFSEFHCHALFSSLDPTRRGYLPCHLLHSLVSVALLRPGASIQVLLMACLRSVVWESMNTNREIREVVKHLISPLSTLNSEYSQRKDLHDLTIATNSQIHFPSAVPSSSSAVAPAAAPHPLVSSEEEQLERDVILMTYLPSHVISSSLRNLCTNDEIEIQLIQQLDHFFHQILNKNVHLIATVPSLSSSSSSSSPSPSPSKGNSTLHEVSGGSDVLGLKRKYDLLMRPKSLTDVRVSDLMEFFTTGNSSGTSSHRTSPSTIPECTKILLSEQRKLHKKLNKYLYKTRDKDRL